MRISRISKVAILATAAVVAIAPSAVATNIAGTGASSVASLIELCKTSYQTDTSDVFTYTSASSGVGQTAINAGTTDLGYSDSVNTAAPSTVFHIPAAVWPIAIAYNLNNSASKPLQLSVPTIAKIFAGKITRWNDPAIVADNARVRSIPVYKVQNGKTVLDANGSPVVDKYRTLTIPFTLPDKPITVMYRSGTSGTTQNLAAALNVYDSTNWKIVGGNSSFTTSNSTDISTLAGTFQAYSTSATIAAAAAANKYSITYVEASYVAKNPALKSVQVINASGKTTSPDVAGAQAQYAASSLNDATGIITWKYDAKSPGAYPFTATTYAMVKTNYGATLAAAVKKQVEYMAFNCPQVAPTEPMIPIAKTSDLGKAILNLTAKIK